MKRRIVAIFASSLETKQAMVIVEALLDSVEDLLDYWRLPDRLPSVEELRPSRCPWCGKGARGADGSLGIVGHGTYSRQILGLVQFLADVVVRIRRFLCRGCGRTTSALPDHLHPGRWYAATVILEALRLHLLEGCSERSVRKRFSAPSGSGPWRSLRRWRRDLGWTLWGWLGARLGIASGAAQTRREGRSRLRRLLAEGASSTPEEPARGLLRGTVHHRGWTWPLGHDPPESLTNRSPP